MHPTIFISHTPYNYQPIINESIHSLRNQLPTLLPIYRSVFADLLRLWPIWTIFIVMGLFRIGSWKYKYYRLSKARMAEIDKMTGSEFEIFLSSLFTKMGYHAEITGHTCDFGCDIVIEKDGIRTSVQAKRYNLHEHVGEAAIQQAYSSVNIYKCSSAMVVTSGYFTPMAIKLAKSNQVELWNRDKLVETILFVKRKDNNKSEPFKDKQA